MLTLQVDHSCTDIAPLVSLVAQNDDFPLVAEVHGARMNHLRNEGHCSKVFVVLRQEMLPSRSTVLFEPKLPEGQRRGGKEEGKQQTYNLHTGSGKNVYRVLLTELNRKLQLLIDKPIVVHNVPFKGIHSNTFIIGQV